MELSYGFYTDTTLASVLGDNWWYNRPEVDPNFKVISFNELPCYLQTAINDNTVDYTVLADMLSARSV